MSLLRDGEIARVYAPSHCVLYHWNRRIALANLQFSVRSAINCAKWKWMVKMNISLSRSFLPSFLSLSRKANNSRNNCQRLKVDLVIFFFKFLFFIYFFYFVSIYFINTDDRNGKSWNLITFYAHPLKTEGK